ncbi:MAG: YdeI/OmpD-associated family protein [Cytophagaceae bacterium]|nr:YdeI/OmpD-associated family protein [Cytophagaceae bacterium]
MHSFIATLHCRHDGQVTMYFVDVPLNVEETFGKTGQIWIRGTANGKPFETTLLPRADGEHYLILNADIRQRAGAQLGEDLDLAIEENPVLRDRELPVPDDLAAVLDDYPDVKAAFERLSKSRRYYLIEWIEEAKKPETRMARLVKSLDEIVRQAPKAK